MTVASITEISAISDQSFEDAIKTGINRTTKTLRGVKGCWVKDMNVFIENGNITGYEVNMEVTFVLEDASQGSGVSEDVACDTLTAGRTVPVEERPEVGGV